MQKLSVFTLCCALALALAGCSSDKGADSGGTAANPATPPAASAPTTPSAGETASATPPAGATAEQKPQSPDGADKKAESGADGAAAKDTDKAPAKGAGAAPKGKGGKMITTASGLQYEDIKVGTGPSPKSGQHVTVDYTGSLADGTKFDSNVDPAFNHVQPFTFVIGQDPPQVIPGWEEGVMTMKVGGKRKLVIPPGLAYGDNPRPGGPIPPGATLTFIVELKGVQ